MFRPIVMKPKSNTFPRGLGSISWVQRFLHLLVASRCVSSYPFSYDSPLILSHEDDLGVNLRIKYGYLLNVMLSPS